MDHAKLTSDTQRLQSLAMTDDLTGLHNLRSFAAHLMTMVQASRRKSGAPLAVLVLDLDRLRSRSTISSDTWPGRKPCAPVGRPHSARVFRAAAVACRYGGDESAIMAMILRVPRRPRPPRRCPGPPHGRERGSAGARGDSVPRGDPSPSASASRAARSTGHTAVRS